jgi:hypothetical protein
VRVRGFVVDTDGGLVIVYNGGQPPSDMPGPYLTQNVAHVAADGTLEDLIVGLDPAGLAAIAVDADYAYVIVESAMLDGSLIHNALLRVPKTGGSSEVLAQSEAGVESLAINADHLYITRAPGEVDGAFIDGGLFSVPKTGGSFTLVAAAQGLEFGDFAVDAQNAYLVAFDGQSLRTSILRIALDGSGQTEIASDSRKDYLSVALSETSVFTTLRWDTTQGSAVPTIQSRPLPTNKTSVRKLCK